MGGSRRATLVNLLKGNVVARVAANLPESMHLITIGGAPLASPIEHQSSTNRAPIEEQSRNNRGTIETIAG
jgi:hypothetical protein